MQYLLRNEKDAMKWPVYGQFWDFLKEFHFQVCSKPYNIQIYSL